MHSTMRSRVLIETLKSIVTEEISQRNMRRTFKMLREV